MTAPAPYADIAAGLKTGRLIAFLGPDVMGLDGPAPAPASPEALALALNARTTVPGRVRGNLWSSAQYIESQKHRQTLDKFLAEIFKGPIAPNRLHHWLASLTAAPLIVDSWYDGALSEALRAAGRSDWGQAQGATRNQIGEDRFIRYFDAAGADAAPDAAEGWGTVLYKPHGSIWPGVNVLVSDADYVEALTEIDIQTPIPPTVQNIRTDRGFVFLGCGFADQTRRAYARQIMKRSNGPHYAVVQGELSKPEQRFFELQGIQLIQVPLVEAVDAILAAAS